MNDKKQILKYIASIYLVIMAAWQGLLGWSANNFISMFESFGTESLATEMLAISHPLIWTFMILSLFLAYETFRRKEIQITNILLISAIVTVSTILLQMHVVVASYTPTFEMSGPQ